MMEHQGRDRRRWRLRSLGPPILMAGVQLAGLAGCGGSDSADPGGPAPTPALQPVCSDSAPIDGTPPLAIQLAARGFADPVDLQAPPGDCRLFIVEQGGRIRVLRDGQVLAAPFLDISGRLGAAGGEQGLLGLAFHPDYASNGRFFVNYTGPSGNTRIAEFRATRPDGNTADAASERTIMSVRQPASNHNGGGLAFGSDGYLYIGLGDGGGGGDPRGNAQNLGTRLGKMLRIDVDGAPPFAVPADNPFVGHPGVLPEIWAYGLRNPWRFAFDRDGGDLFIADVGQSRIEEIDLGRATRGGGENYGWNIVEGTACYQPASGCDRTGLTPPIATYTHNDGCSITGGIVYRGRRMPGYHGTYFYSDYCAAFLRSLRVENGTVVDRHDWTPTVGPGLDRVVSFGTDADGEAYIVNHGGEIYRIVPRE